MKLYLCQHGEAKLAGEDPARPLTDKGLNDIKKMSHFLKSILQPARIYHSGKLRALETARVYANTTTAQLHKADGIASKDEPHAWADILNSMDEDIMLVGHIPHLARLTSLLMFGDANIESVRFKMGCVVCLQRETDQWVLEWVITPELIMGKSATCEE